MAALAVLVLQPTLARADTFENGFFPAHWGPNPYITVPPTDANYRSLAVVDNTGDPALAADILYFTQLMNYVHYVYNTNYPVMYYFKDMVFQAGNPCALGPAQFLIVCKDETLGGTGAPGAPATAAIFPTPAPVSHILYAVARFRPSVVDPWCPGDKWTVVAQILSNTMGLDHNLTNAASAMYPTLPVGRCTYNGWTSAEFDRLNQAYSHAAG